MLHAYNPPSRFLPYLSWTEIAELPNKENTVIVLPTGATEQHGPHLPCSVDTTISAGVVGHALTRLPDHVPAYAMAPITYGKSEEHLHFPGTMTLTGETLLATMNEIGESVYRAGFRKLLIVNGHGGQPQVMEISARELRLRHGDFIVVPSFTWRVPHSAGQYLSDKEKKLAMHAGHAETALMWHWPPKRCTWKKLWPITLQSFPPNCCRPMAVLPALGALETLVLAGSLATLCQPPANKA